MTATLKYRLAFPAKGRRPAACAAKAGPAPRLAPGPSRTARMLALAHYVEQLIEAGRVTDVSDAGRRLGLTRGRMSQVMALLHLSPTLQEAVLLGTLRIAEHYLRDVVREAGWAGQEKAVKPGPPN